MDKFFSIFDIVLVFFFTLIQSTSNSFTHNGTLRQLLCGTLKVFSQTFLYSKNLKEI